MPTALSKAEVAKMDRLCFSPQQAIAFHAWEAKQSSLAALSASLPEESREMSRRFGWSPEKEAEFQAWRQQQKGRV